MCQCYTGTYSNKSDKNSLTIKSSPLVKIVMNCSLEKNYTLQKEYLSELQPYVFHQLFTYIKPIVAKGVNVIESFSNSW